MCGLFGNPPNGELEFFGGFHFFNATTQTGSGPNFYVTLLDVLTICIALRFHNKTPQTGFGLLKQQTSGQSSWDAQGQPGDDDGDNDDDYGGDGGGDGDGDVHCTGAT